MAVTINCKPTASGITAFAFARPRVGMIPHLPKVVGFRDAWDIAEMPARIDFGDLADSVGIALAQDGARLASQAQTVSETYLSSFDAMVSKITGR